MSGAAASRAPVREPAPVLNKAANDSLRTVREGFDRAAATYDQDFTDSAIGRLQREAVWRQLDDLLLPGDLLLDLGCGTGSDAIHLARRGLKIHAVDLS